IGVRHRTSEVRRGPVARASRAIRSAGLGAGSAAAEEPQDAEQDQGADEGDDDAPDEADAAVDEEAGKEAGDEGADEADDDVADQPVAVAPADRRGRPTGHQSHDDPGDDAARRKLHGHLPHEWRDHLSRGGDIWETFRSGLLLSRLGTPTN